MNKLVLGTAQFGLDYGITNSRGIIPKKEALEILELAKSSGIEMLDTAYDYGESEKVIGDYTLKNNKSFKLISKLNAMNLEEFRKQFMATLGNLQTSRLYSYLFHHFYDYAANPEILLELEKQKKEGKIEKIGFSLYFPSELEYLFSQKISFDTVQVPFSILDQRFMPYFQKLKEMGKEISVRSVFLQGLFFQPMTKLTGRFMKVVPRLFTLQKLAKESKDSISSLCLNFCLANPHIDKVVIGVDSISNLLENLESAKRTDKISQIEKELKALAEEDEEIILPFNWRKE